MRAPAILRAVVELALAGAAILGCALSWARVRSSVLVAPIADGEPVTTSVSYHPQPMLLALLLAAAAGALGVVGAARLCRIRRRRTAGAAVSLNTCPEIPPRGII